MEEHMQELRKKQNEARKKFQPNHQCHVSSNILLALQADKHVYIQGEPGYGKTELVDYFLTGKNYWKPGEPSNFLFGTLPEKTDYIWFEDFDIVKYHNNIINILSLMDHKETTVSKKCCDDKTIVTHAKFIFTTNYNIGFNYNMFERRVNYHHVCYKMYDCRGCRPNFIPDNQQGLFSIDGEQLFIDLSEAAENFTVS
jgi:hypothetical protein